MSAGNDAGPDRAPGRGRHRVVVLGGGFGGLEAVKQLRDPDIEVTLVDRNNYHLFQPLSYQVATGALSPDEIGKPLRAIFRRQENVRVLMAEVTELDLDRRIVGWRSSEPESTSITAHMTPLSSPAARAIATSATRSGVE